ncbi:elongator complex protein 4 [Schistocerca cancellata]|uniref:elongator complex protein 4 n=1 Tax=Schistocerca cancellata TaxID=274614 RepID=UPI00211840D2|nr:elongator complex protein 4 [Schistocerca cancellata]
MSQSTSFQKKGKSKVPPIQGTKPSIHNAQLLISSGVPSLDYVFGGGIPVGTVMLVEEDKYGTFSKFIMKYFLAEGVVCGHSVIAASQDVDPEAVVAELPAMVQEDDSEPSNSSTADEKMKIAWRYQNIKPGIPSQSRTSFGHNYDLSRTMDLETIKTANILYWHGSQCQPTESSGHFAEAGYGQLLEFIRDHVEEGGFSVHVNPEHRSILRVGVTSIGSPLWGPVEDISDLCHFLYCLRSLIRSAFGVCLLTLPWHLFEPISGAVERFEHLVDYVVRLEAWEGDVLPALRDYNGLLHLRKLPAINTLAPHIPESLDLAFRLRRKKFVIQKLHLPPELQESTEREQDELIEPSGSRLPCGKALDF